MTTRTRVKRTKKAVSPVIAVLLLILIAVAAALVLYVWVSGMVAAKPAGSERVQESIAIDTAGFDKSGFLNIYVRNVGTVPTEIKAAYVYILNATTGEKQLAYADTALSIRLSPGNIVEISISKDLLKPKPGNGDTITVEVVTKTGVKASYEFVYYGSS